MAPPPPGPGVNGGWARWGRGTKSGVISVWVESGGVQLAANRDEWKLLLENGAFVITGCILNRY